MDCSSHPGKGQASCTQMGKQILRSSSGARRAPQILAGKPLSGPGCSAGSRCSVLERKTPKIVTTCKNVALKALCVMHEENT